MGGTLATVSALLGLFLGSGAAGLGLAWLFAPGSWIAEVVSFFALPVAFAAGLQAWYGLALLGLVPRLVELLVSRSRPGSVVATGPRRLAGSIVFLPLSSGAGFLAGLVVGLISPTSSLWLVLLAYWLLGTGHGLLAWRLARGGVLVPPETI